MPDPRQHRIRRPGHFRPLAAEPAEDLRFIRDTIARSSSFTAVSGLGQIMVGTSALAAAYFAAHALSSGAWLRIWLADAVIAAAIAVVCMRAKASRLGLPLLTGPGRKVAAGLGPAFAAAAVLTYLLHHAAADSIIPPAWILLYGAGVLAAGAYSVSLVPVMGLSFMAAGTLAALSPASWGNAYLAASFGGLHILFGILIARRHGG
jgi:hypothetical protein